MIEYIRQDEDNLIIESYESYVEQGHSWCWCLVGNIVESHEYGEEHEMKSGTKHFSRGTKVYLAPGQWGDGYENVVVIGLPRQGSKYGVRERYLWNRYYFDLKILSFNKTCYDGLKHW